MVVSLAAMVMEATKLGTIRGGRANIGWKQTLYRIYGGSWESYLLQLLEEPEAIVVVAVVVVDIISISGGEVWREYNMGYRLPWPCNTLVSLVVYSRSPLLAPPIPTAKGIHGTACSDLLLLIIDRSN
jgi:hypothetical protein